MAKSERIAQRDIVRKNSFGQNAVVVPKGQPIPDGLEVTDEEAGIQKKAKAAKSKKAEPLENK